VAGRAIRIAFSLCSEDERRESDTLGGTDTSVDGIPLEGPEEYGEPSLTKVREQQEV
jgi:hypothetical protein